MYGRGKGSEHSVTIGPTNQKCPNCARSHPPNKCGAVGRKCNGCNKLGHYLRVCPSNKEGGAHAINEENTSSVHIEQINKAPTVVVGICSLNGKKLGTSEALLDTGADTSIADQRFLRSVGVKKTDLKKL